MTLKYINLVLLVFFSWNWKLSKNDFPWNLCLTISAQAVKSQVGTYWRKILSKGWALSLFCTICINVQNTFESYFPDIISQGNVSKTQPPFPIKKKKSGHQQLELARYNIRWKTKGAKRSYWPGWDYKLVSRCKTEFWWEIRGWNPPKEYLWIFTVQISRII